MVLKKILSVLFFSLLMISTAFAQNSEKVEGILAEIAPGF